LSKKVVIVQSNYIPWKGYFDLMHVADELILFDDVQYTRRDWRNRNLIKTREGPAWLSIPVKAAGNYLAPIKDIEVDGDKWREKHWRTIVSSYARAPHFRDHAATFEALYLGSPPMTLLSHVNRAFLEAVCGILGIRTKLSWSMDYEVIAGKTERIVSLCRQAEARTYLSGPSARGYLDPAMFEAAGLELVFFDYSGYPEYPQLYPPFTHEVTVLDLLFSEGPRATSRMLTFSGV
jgi:WbqC-like protein family